jgi:hypothetical protein
VPGWLSRYSDWLRAGRSGDQIPVGARFFAPVQTGPGAHPTSCTIVTGSFSGVKWPGRGADHKPLLAPRSRECRGTLLPPLWVFESVTGYLYLYLYCLTVRHLSIKLSRIYVLHEYHVILSVRYYMRFHVTEVVLGTC